MADQAQQGGVALAIGHRIAALARQVAPGGDQRGAGPVLQPAVAVSHGIEQKHIALQRRLGLGNTRAGGVPKVDLLGADALGIGQQPRAVKARQCAGHHKLMRYTAGLEVAAPEPAQLNRVVEQLVVVGGLEDQGLAVSRRGHRRGHLPARRQPAELQAVRFGLTTQHPQAQAAAVEKPALGVEKRRPHRVVKRIHPVAHLQRTATAAAHPPAALVELFDRQLTLSLAGAQAREVAAKLAHHVAAGNPHRQSQHLVGRRLRHRQGELKVVAVQVGKRDAVGDHPEACRERKWVGLAGALEDGAGVRCRPPPESNSAPPR